ncbi:MAG: hypothetical protein MHM6MM_006571 [Cercozoa sp. M6MM]
MSATDNVNHRIVWIDLEMTGLDVENDHIVEAACIVTDEDLNIIATFDSRVIGRLDENTPIDVDAMNEWCKTTFAKTGLTRQIQESTMTTRQCEEELLAFVKKHVKERKAPLGGNSVHADRAFLAKEMPEFHEFVHYRNIDVSTLKELAWRWCPPCVPPSLIGFFCDSNRLCRVARNAPKKKMRHRALDDIRESIDELRYYRLNMLAPCARPAHASGN